MTDGRELDCLDGQICFDQLKAISQDASELGAKILHISESIHETSLAALQKTNPQIAGTLMAEEWPLAAQYRLRNMITDSAVGNVKRHGEPLPMPVFPEIPTPLISDKYRNDYLVEVYGETNPREGFVADLVAWADEMDTAGLPVLVDVDLAESHRVTVSVYENNEVNNSRIISAKERFKDEGEPAIWVSPKVVVTCDDEGLSDKLLQEN